MAQVFISYSRHDHDVAFRLREALIANKRDVWMDLQNIPPSAKWEREIAEALSGADAIVCLLSPEYIASPACKQEVDQAVAEHKRIIPVVVRDVNPQQVWPALASLNWIFLRPTDNPQQALQQLYYALDTDLEFWHTASRLLVHAQQWDGNGRHASATLRGAELVEAENWLGESATKRPGPPPLLRDYIAASRRATARRQRTTISLLSVGLIITAGLTVLASIFAVRLNLANITLTQQNRDLQASALAGRANLLTDNHQIDQALLVSDFADHLNDNPDTRGALLGAVDSSPFLARILPTTEQATALGNDLQFSADGKTLWYFTASAAQRWDMTTLARSATIPLPDSQQATLAPDGQHFVEEDALGNLTLWDGAAGKMVASFGTLPVYVFANSPHAMLISPDGTTLAVATCAVQNGAGSCANSGVALWNMHTLRRIGTVPLPFDAEYVNLAFTPDNHALLVGACQTTQGVECTSSILVRWNLASQRIARSRIIPSSSGQIFDIALTSDGQTLITAGSSGACMNLVCPGGKLAGYNATTLAPNPGETHSDAYFTFAHLTISPDGQHVLFDLTAEQGSRLALNNGWQLFSLATGGVETSPFTAFNDAASTAVAFSPDSQHFVTADSVGRLLLWNVKPYTPQSLVPGPDLDGYSPAIYTADGAQLITATTDGRIIFWNAHTGAKLSAMPDNLAPGVTVTLALLPDGKTLAVGDATGTITFWDLATRQQKGTPINVPATPGFSPAIAHIAFNAAGTQMMTSSLSNHVLLWNLATGHILHDYTQTFVNSQDQGWSRGATISADGSMLAIGSQAVDNLDHPNDYKVYVIDAHAQTVSKVLSGYDAFIDSTAFSPDGSLLATTDDSGTVIVWDTHTWQSVLTVKLSASSTTIPFADFNLPQVSFSVDGTKLIAAWDNHILLWDTHTHAPFVPLITEIGNLTSVAISPDGTQMAVALTRAGVAVHSLVPSDWQAQACAITHRNLNPSEWTQDIGTNPSYQTICPGLS